jgi:hypothetical protein
MTNNFTDEEVSAAISKRDDIIAFGTPNQKAAYMAGEIVMWDEMRQPASPSAPSNDYWKQMYELMKAMYEKINLGEYHGKEYKEWQALKSNPQKEGELK